MRETVRDLLKSTAISIGMAMTIFCLAGIVFDVGSRGNFSLDHYRFTKLVAGCVLTGLGFGVPTIVWLRRLYSHSLCRRLDRLRRDHRTGNHDRFSAACRGFCHLVPVPEILPGGSKKDER